MPKVKQLPKHADVDKSLTWDLSKIFKTQAEFKQACTQMENLIAQQKKLVQKFDSPAALSEVLGKILAADRKLALIYVYASMNNDIDTSDASAQALFATAENLVNDFAAQTAWFEPAVLAVDKATMKEWLNHPKLRPYARYLAQILQKRSHILTHDQEQLLAAASGIFNGAENTYATLTNADMDFGVVEDEKNQQVELNDSVYARLLETKNRSVRKRAFDQLYSVYRQYEHTLAQTLITHAKTQNYLAITHNYQNAKQAALAKNEIPSQIYDTLVQKTHDNLGLLHEYVELRKQILQLDNVEMYDMYVPLVEREQKKYSYQAAKPLICAALEPLGADYQTILRSFFEQRMIDVVATKNKRSGAYSGGSYDTLPYILLNWQDNQESVYTLIHELGHSMHSHYTRKNQPYVTGDYPIFLAEIASTTNENLLTDYLLAHETNPIAKAAILNHYLDTFKGTVFRQTQFAEFEWWLHDQLQKNQPLTAADLDEKYAKINELYYGIKPNESAAIRHEWSRIPHFYYNFYVYQYATGFALASSFANRLKQDQKTTQRQYVNFLKSGDSFDAPTTLKQAGIDVLAGDYLDEAFAMFKLRLDQLKQLLFNK